MFCLKKIQEKKTIKYKTVSPYIADARKCLLTWAWYSCPLRGFARANTDADAYSQQSDWTWKPYGEVRGRTDEAEGVWTPYEEQQYQPIRTHPQSSQD